MAPATRMCSVELTWLAVSAGERFSIAFLVALAVAMFTAMPRMLVAAPTYITLTAFRTEAGAGARWVCGIWALPG